MNEDERVAAQQRDKLRADRKRDRERELRLENMKGNFKKQKMDRERDISEKIALGQLKVSAAIYAIVWKLLHACLVVYAKYQFASACTMMSRLMRAFLVYCAKCQYTVYLVSKCASVPVYSSSITR
jgi:hypothetical protein